MLYDKWAEAVLRVHGRGGEKVGRSELNRLVETAPRAYHKLGDDLGRLPILYVEESLDALVERMLEVQTGPSNMVGFLLRRSDFDDLKQPHKRGHEVRNLRSRLAECGLGLAAYHHGARYIRGVEVIGFEWAPIFYDRGKPATIADKFQRMLAILMHREPGEVSIAECNAFLASVTNPRKGLRPYSPDVRHFYIAGPEISFEEFSDDFLLEAEECDPEHRNLPLIHFLVEKVHAPHLRSYFKVLLDELLEHGMDVHFALDTETTVKNGRPTLACQMVPIFLEPVVVQPLKVDVFTNSQPMAKRLFGQFVNTLTRHFEIPLGTYSASELNAIVDSWPDPVKMCQSIESDLAQFSIAFDEIGFQQIGQLLMQFGRSEINLMPIFLLEDSRMNDWQQDVNVQTLLAYLETEHLGARVTYEKEMFLCRGKWVRGCDLRPVFLQGATIEQAGGNSSPRFNYGSGGGGGGGGTRNLGSSRKGIQQDIKQSCLCAAVGQLVCGAKSTINCPRLRA